MLNKQIGQLDIFIRQKRLIADGLVPFSAPTLWRRVKDGSFPAPVKVSPGCTAWRLSDVKKWQEAHGV